MGSSGDSLGWTTQLVKALVYLSEDYFVRLEKQTSDLWDSAPLTVAGFWGTKGNVFPETLKICVYVKCLVQSLAHRLRYMVLVFIVTFTKLIQLVGFRKLLVQCSFTTKTWETVFVFTF